MCVVQVQLDYEVESDDEWEEEEPGESLSDCENNKEGEEENEEEEEEDDDGFFVPHGYLSEGEGCEDDEEDVSGEGDKGEGTTQSRVGGRGGAVHCVSVSS